MIRLRASGSFRKTTDFLSRQLSRDIAAKLDAFGRAGVLALSDATPQDSGATALSWDFEIVRNQNTTTIHWFNTNENAGANIAILLQYGHATGTGGYVAGRDYINPAIQPVFDRIESEVWDLVVRS